MYAMPDDGAFKSTGPQRRRGRGSGGVTGRGFAPGVSGCPGGRSRATQDVQELARQHTSEAIAALVAALANPRERVPAAIALLERGWGKPKQPFEADVNGISWVIRIPAEPQSTEEWLETYAPEHIRQAKRLEQQKAAAKVIDGTPSGKVIDVPQNSANDDVAE